MNSLNLVAINALHDYIDIDIRRRGNTSPVKDKILSEALIILNAHGVEIGQDRESKLKFSLAQLGFMEEVLDYRLKMPRDDTTIHFIEEIALSIKKAIKVTEIRLIG